VAREIAVNRSSVTRHVKSHLLLSLVVRMAADSVLAELDPLAELRALFGRMKRHLASAEESRNLVAIKLIGAEVRAALELFGKFQAMAAATAQTGDKFRGMSPENKSRALLALLAKLYGHDPAGFLEGIRGRAAEMLSRGPGGRMIRKAIEGDVAAAKEIADFPSPSASFSGRSRSRGAWRGFGRSSRRTRSGTPSRRGWRSGARRFGRFRSSLAMRTCA
jgi:hypothetical protein